MSDLTFAEDILRQCMADTPVDHPDFESIQERVQLDELLLDGWVIVEGAAQ